MSTPARLHWGPTKLYFGPWTFGEIEPRWRGAMQTPMPSHWWGRVGLIWEDSNFTTPQAAMEGVEAIVFGQLVGLGFKRAVFVRPDRTIRELRHP